MSEQITVWFHNVVVVVSSALCGCGDESTASDAPFSFSSAPLRFMRFIPRPKGEEHVYLSSRRSVDPRGPASNRGRAPAVIFRVVLCRKY